MSAQTALARADRFTPSGEDLESKQQLVESLYASFQVACGAALRACEQDDSSRLVMAATAAVQITATLRDCLDYARAPVLCAYLNSMFDQVITQLTIGRGAHDPSSIELARAVMAELGDAFLATHRARR